MVEGRSHRRAGHARGEADHIDECAADAEGEDCTVGTAINEPDSAFSFAENEDTHYAPYQFTELDITIYTTNHR